MKRHTVIGHLRNQKLFKKAVIEMLESENGILDREIDYHQKQIENGNDDIPDEKVYNDKQTDDNPFR